MIHAGFWWVAEWALLTVAGLFIGTFLGADRVGVIQGISGDLVFGLIIGLAQLVVLNRWFPGQIKKLAWWSIACMLAFTMGAVLGRRMSGFLLNYSVLLTSAGFGGAMGISHGVLQWLVLRRLPLIEIRRAIYWIGVASLAWMLGELVSSGFGTLPYSLWLSIPTGLSIGLVMGIGWVWLFGSPQSR